MKGVRIHMPHFPPCIPMHPIHSKLLRSQITFLAILKPLLLNPNDSVAAVTLVNEVLLSEYFFVFMVVAARLFVIYWLAIHSRFTL